jgi:hypothetical protein
MCLSRWGISWFIRIRQHPPTDPSCESTSVSQMSHSLIREIRSDLPRRQSRELFQLCYFKRSCIWSRLMRLQIPIQNRSLNFREVLPPAATPFAWHCFLIGNDHWHWWNADRPINLNDNVRNPSVGWQRQYPVWFGSLSAGQHMCVIHSDIKRWN